MFNLYGFGIWEVEGINPVQIRLILNSRALQKLQIILMREQTDSHSSAEATSSIQPKNHTLLKKKTIAKDKQNIPAIQLTEKTTKKLSKEERAKIQKEKNREAAQRSRDIHKEYVNNLEQEVKSLREKVEHSLRYCHRCQEIINLQQTILQNQDVGLAFGQAEIQNEAVSLNEANQEQPEQLEPESFLRWLEPQEEVPLMKIMLLVCMIAIAVIASADTTRISSNVRNLVQKYEQQPNKPQIALIPAVEEYTQRERGLVQLSLGISNQKCLDSLMKVESIPLRKSLRSIHEANSSQEASNIMLCSLKTPKSYQIKYDISDSPVVKLFISGSDVKKMVEGSESMLKLTHRNIQLNGIYRLAAEIKSVDLLQHHSCIL